MDKLLLHGIIKNFLAEDIGRGDITSEAIFTQGEIGRANLVARENLIAAGVGTVAAEVFFVQNPAITVTDVVAEGAMVADGGILMSVSGPVLDLLKAERVALNLLQRLSGIATLTSAYVEEVKEYPAKITDTRKTTPGLRMLEKYAVLAGGGFNHRYNLTDGVLIKDNHIAACGSITRAVERVRARAPHTVRIEVETDTLEQVQECLEVGVDIIMLDNMSTARMTEAVGIIGNRAIVEASGGISLGTVREVAACGVDIISVGALTHSAPGCDIGMDWVS